MCVRVYGVFEGGGAKGLALVGALARVQKEFKEASITFAGFAGTSAGAIVAALASAGYPAHDSEAQMRRGPGSGEPVDLQTVLEELDMNRFLDGENDISLLEVKTLEKLYRSVLGPFFQDADRIGGRFSRISRWRFWTWFLVPALLSDIFSARDRYRNQLDALPRLKNLIGKLREQKGIYRTQTFCGWLESLLRGRIKDAPNVTFERLAECGSLLKVVATDLRERRPEVYSPRTHPKMYVTDAVRQSMSIPFFFAPCQVHDNFFVDGGIISNFPAWVFDEERKADRKRKDSPVVLGFRLVPDEETEPDELNQAEPPFGKFGEYALAVFNALTEGTDQLQTRQIDEFVSIDIKVKKSITATRFDLTLDERKELYRRGWVTADDVISKAEVRQRLGLAH